MLVECSAAGCWYPGKLLNNSAEISRQECTLHTAHGDRVTVADPSVIGYFSGDQIIFSEYYGGVYQVCVAVSCNMD